MLKYLLFSLLIAFTGSAFASAHSVLDSTGIEKKGGKTYIVHKVEPKETLYSLSKRYGVTIEEIKKANEDLTADLKVGQTLLIPTKYTAPVVHPASVKTHTVEPQETLYSISKKYGVSVDELKKANPNVPVDDMKVGQMLILPKSGSAVNTPAPSANPKTHKLEPKETLYALSRKYEVTVEDLKKANPGVDINDLKVGQIINIPQKSAVTHADVRKVTPADPVVKKDPLPVTVKKTDPKSTVTTPRPETNLPEIKKDGYTKVNESGFAEMYEASSDFHYALHSSAPIGTIIYVESEDGEQKVYVRVMGRLDNPTPGVIMKLSKKAFEKVSKGDSKVKISSSYIP